MRLHLIMNKVITLTMNPVVDKDTSVAGIKPNTKLRCVSPTYYAGGGGINVSRAIKQLGGESLCLYMAGGLIGSHLQQLVVADGITQKVIAVEGWTRENLSVTDTITNLHYRFGVPGPNVKEDEWQMVLKFLEEQLHKDDFLVASGKLPPGVPPDFYVKTSKITDTIGAKLILDTSGVALLPSIKAKTYMMKPNLGELSILCGVDFISDFELESLSKKFLEENNCEVLVVSMGAKGALLVTKDIMKHVLAPTVQQKSTIGAGDSMVAGMVLKLLKGKSLIETVEYGVACGSAATIYPGTQLCTRVDADNLYELIKEKTVHNSKKNA